METVTPQGGVSGSGSGVAYRTGSDRAIRDFGEGGRITSDGLGREVSLPKSRRGDKLAQGLGWFSIGLGVAQIVAPRSVSRLIGVSDADGNTRLMRAIGLREISAGIGLLTDPKPTGFAVARVAGDVMDLALLANALTTPKNDRSRTALATAAVVGVGLLDILASEELATTTPKVVHAPRDTRALQIRKSVTVNRPVEEVYAFWRNFENFPRFMKHLDSVRNSGERRSLWSAGSAEGVVAEWEVELVDDRPNELISWRTIGVSELTGQGIVEFRPAPGDRGTEVRANISYEPPGGALGAKIARIFRDLPGVKIENQLNVFKQIMETGEEVRSDSSIHRGPHPAQPSSSRMNFDTGTTA